MAIALTITGIEAGDDLLHIYGTIAFSGNYTAGGDTLNFANSIGAQARDRVFAAGKGPVAGWIQGTTGDSYGLVAEPNPSVTNGYGLQTAKIKINTASNTELGAGAYPARITGDANVYFEFDFEKNL